MKPWLSPSDLQELTDRQRPTAQIKQLQAMGIPYRMRTTGQIVVLRSDMGEIPQPRQTTSDQPDLSMI